MCQSAWQAEGPYYPLAVPGNSFVALRCTANVTDVLTGGAGNLTWALVVIFSEEVTSSIREWAGGERPHGQLP